MVLRGLLGHSLPDTTEIELPAGPVSVRVRKNPRAKAYRLSISARGEPVLTVPGGGKWREAEAFLARNAGWLSQRLKKIESPYRLAPDGLIPFRGIDHRLVSLNTRRGTVAIVQTEDGPWLEVPGGTDHLHRRLFDWLKKQAKADLDTACAFHADRLGVTVAAIRMRDQSTRWGSCSSQRVLNFNWRLVLAPPFVLDYVAAHEVAHILEMNHKPVFWRTVARTLPDYEKGKAWLKANGSKLMAVQ